MARPHPERSRAWWPASLLLVAAGAAALGLAGAIGRQLSMDELMSANFSAHGPWAALLTALRFDVHPPVYYLQLAAWMAVSASDGWLMANSAVWHAVSVVLLGCAAAAQYGRRVGLAAALLLAVAPASVHYAYSVRMYTWVSACLVAAWWALDRWFEKGARRRHAVLAILTQAAVANSHTAGPLLLSGLLAYGLWTALATARREVMLRWMLLECLAIALTLPAIVIGATRGVDHTVAPGLSEVVSTWTYLVGAGALPSAVAWTLGAVILALLVMAGWRDRGTARVQWTLVAGPMVLALATSYLVKPAWLPRVFVPLLPFICLGMARGLMVVGPPRRSAGLVLGVAAAWAAISFSALRVQPVEETNIHLVAEAIRSRAGHAVTVLATPDYVYWCLAWSLQGPEWGDPRQAFVTTPAWESLMRRLPTKAADWWGLGTRDRVTRVGPATVVMWDPLDAVPVTDLEVLLLSFGAPVSLPLSEWSRIESQTLDGLTFERWVRR